MKPPALTALLGAFVTSLLMTSVMAGSVTTESNGVRLELQSTPGTPVADQRAA